MTSFNIAIPNDKAATYKVVTLFILCSNFLAFGYAVLYSEANLTKFFLYAGLLISSLAILVFFLRSYTEYTKRFRLEIAFILCAVAWLFSDNYLLGILLFIFAMAGWIANRQQVIYFCSEHIRYPSFPEKIFLWQDVDFVILKDDILTIEMKDNRLMQFTLDKEVTAHVDAEAFNSFCRNMAGEKIT